MKKIFNKKTILDNFLSAFGAFLCISLLSFLHFSEYGDISVSYTHLRAHETLMNLVCRLLLEKKKD